MSDNQIKSRCELEDPLGLVQQIMYYAIRARKDGILAQYNLAEEDKKSGFQLLGEFFLMAVDATEPLTIQEHIELDMQWKIKVIKNRFFGLGRFVYRQQIFDIERAYTLIKLGIFGIQSGDSPRYLEKKLFSVVHDLNPKSQYFGD
jgi:flagellar motor component MotA